MNETETIIVGGGPAGAAAASGLAAFGREVALIERATGAHHKVCGEFISVETQGHLQRLGLDAGSLGAVPIDRVAIHAGARPVEAPLPFRALSLSRHRLDDALLRLAGRRGAQVRRGISVRSVVRDGAGWMVFTDGGDMMRCRNLVLASGKWNLRGVDDRRDGSMVGLKMHLRPSDELRRQLRDRVELFLLGRGYLGLELVEDGIANLCCLLPRAQVAEVGAGWPALHRHLAAAHPTLAERLMQAEPLWDKAIAVVCPTNGHLHSERGAEAFRIGDRLAHIPPFTGDGLAIALGSAALAVDCIRAGRSPAAYLATARRLTGGQIRLAGFLSAAAASRAGRVALAALAAPFPGLIAAIAQRTRLRPALH